MRLPWGGVGQGCEGFYNGTVAAAVASLAESAGLKVTTADFVAHNGEWVTPLNTTYRDR